MDSMYVYLHTAKQDQVIFTKESYLFKEKHIDTNAYTPIHVQAKLLR